LATEKKYATIETVRKRGRRDNGINTGKMSALQK
jgi:hypothetical protein